MEIKYTLTRGYTDNVIAIGTHGANMRKLVEEYHNENIIISLHKCQDQDLLELFHDRYPIGMEIDAYPEWENIVSTICRMMHKFNLLQLDLLK